tara:strand:+ start:631 stop:777 length:147 start_codon:yes stop_codon:yes gene_type:complete
MMDLVIVEAEMVADLVHQHMADDLVQAHVAALAPLIKDRPAIEEDTRP